YGKYSTKMFVSISSDGNVMPHISHIIDEPQNILFDEDKAIEKANQLNLETPRKLFLIYSDETEYLAWRMEWNHTPTIEERINETVSGYIFRADNGDIIKTLRFKIEPVQNEHVAPTLPQNYKLIIVLIFSLSLLLLFFFIRRRN
ncbi:MAG: hypothetical protein KAI26_08180, partial [Nanoarchaeota archaeon]|nr:hypothetical protein [Nanoarchaeota archaeon]